MKSFFVFIFSLIIFSSAVNAQSQDEKYDSILANKLHADEFGMKNYIFVILKSGSETMTDKVAEDSIFHGHLNNITRLANEGKLLLAGPFGKNNDNYSGIFILNVSSMEDAKNLLATDPAIHANLLEPVMYPWYGSASLQEIMSIHKKIQKTKF